MTTKQPSTVHPLKTYLHSFSSFFIQHKKLLAVFLGGVFFVAVSTFVLAHFFTAASTPQSSETPDVTQVVTASPTPPPDPLRPYTVLLLGYGGKGHDGGGLTDTLLVAYIAPREKRAVLFSIPRDVWVSIPLDDSQQQWAKVNAAFAIGNDDRTYPSKQSLFSGEGGGGRLAKHVVSEIIGVPVDFFMAVDFSGFVQVLDSLGTLNVVVPVAFTDDFYPIPGLENETCDKSEEELEAINATMSGYLLEQQFGCRYQHLAFEAGPQEMDGQTALTFVRSRHSLQHGGDFGRSQRQQALVTALKDKLLSPAFIVKSVPTARALLRYVQTDVTLEKISEVLATHPNLPDYTLKTVRLTDQNALKQTYSPDRQYILVPTSGSGNWESTRDFFRKEVVEK